MKPLPLALLLASLIATGARAQISVDMSKSFTYIPVGNTSTIAATHVKVPGMGNYNATFKFNAATLGFDLNEVTPSQTDENTESLTGIYTCFLYNGSQPIFTTTILPVGQDLIFGGGMQYRFHSTSGSNIWKYTVSFSDGGKYLLSMVKESATVTKAILGYLPSGETELDTGNTLRCEKKG